jgi:quercetin dioxygenase-like cupin family protein
MSDLTPWESNAEAAHSDQLKRFVHQDREEHFVNHLPRVIKPIPPQGTMNGHSSPHQTGDLLCYDILNRAPMHILTCHFSDIPANAPVRGAHRHISAPTLFCIAGKGWEWNDGVTYEFEVFDLLIVPPYTIHQHGGDRDVGCQIYVPQSRMIHALGLLHREQIKFADKPTFPDGTEPLYDNDKTLIGYRIKKGILGITEDIDVFLGPSPDVEGVFRARLESKEWSGPTENTYDRYLKLLGDEVKFCKSITHVIRYEEQPWEWTRQGRLKWYTHPHIDSSARRVWLYLQEIPPASRSGKHRHMTEEQIFIINGNGYDIQDGERWNWQKGDLINIPAMVEHQHFNSDPDNPVLLMSSMPSMCADLGVGGIEQIEDAPEYNEKGR